MRESSFTFIVDEELKGQFAMAAKFHDANDAQLLRDFMLDFVRQQQGAAGHDAWFKDAVQMGLDAANAGDVLSAREVEENAQAWRAHTRGNIAGPKA